MSHPLGWLSSSPLDDNEAEIFAGTWLPTPRILRFSQYQQVPTHVIFHILCFSQYRQVPTHGCNFPYSMFLPVPTSTNLTFRIRPVPTSINPTLVFYFLPVTTSTNITFRFFVVPSTNQQVPFRHRLFYLFKEIPSKIQLAPVQKHTQKALMGWE